MHRIVGQPFTNDLSDNKFYETNALNNENLLNKETNLNGEKILNVPEVLNSGINFKFCNFYIIFIVELSTNLPSSVEQFNTSIIVNNYEESESAINEFSQTCLEIEFEIQIISFELNVQLLPSLKAKYKLEKAIGTGSNFSGNTMNFSAEVATHQLYFLVAASSVSLNQEAGFPLDTFTLQLPKICANGSFKSNVKANLCDEDWNLQRRYCNDGYYDIVIYIGIFL